VGFVPDLYRRPYLNLAAYASNRLL
jgi:hypothetical protein